MNETRTETGERKRRPRGTCPAPLRDRTANPYREPVSTQPVADTRAAPRWSWVFLAASIVAALYVAVETGLRLLVDCKEPTGLSYGPNADFSFYPPGVTCTYDLGGEGVIAVEPS